MSSNFDSIQEVQQALLGREISLKELVSSYLDTIEKEDSELNAMITITRENAINRAIQLTEVLENLGEKAFQEFPLLGVTITLKDIYLTKGVKTTAAAKLLEDYIPQYSSTVVERLEKAGAIIIGKTNLDAWAHGSSGENSDFGPTKNPWDTEVVPGGSSSGSAVSVAADYSLVSFGTDTGGSIRLPASFTGVVGYKPTYGLVPRYGVIAMASSLDSMGHFARSVEDIEKVLEVTAGPDGKDATVVDSSKYTVLSIKQNYKVGIPKEYFSDGLDSEIKSKIEEAIEEYKKLGVEFVEVSLPHTKYSLAVYYIIMSAEVSSNLGRYDGIRYGQNRSAFNAEAKRRIMLGTYVLSAGYYDAYYLKAMKVRSKLIEDFENAFAEVDAIISPVSPNLPFKLGEKTTDPLQMYLADIYTVAANLAGIPGLALPGGFSKTGLPIGFQLLGPRFSEKILFDLGKKYQNVTDHHRKRPLL